MKLPKKKYLAILACAGVVAAVAIAQGVDGTRLNIYETGQSNDVVSGKGSGAMGILNDVDSRRSLAVGGANDLMNGGSYYGFAVGVFNTINTPYLGGFAAGRDNFLNKNHSAAIGYGVHAKRTEGQVVVGRFNDYAEHDSKGEAVVFSVGNGTGSSQANRSNALVVHQDGAVVVPTVQGDIEMGSFSN